MFGHGVLHLFVTLLLVKSGDSSWFFDAIGDGFNWAKDQVVKVSETVINAISDPVKFVGDRAGEVFETLKGLPPIAGAITAYEVANNLWSCGPDTGDLGTLGKLGSRFAVQLEPRCRSKKDEINSCCVNHDKCYSDQKGRTFCDNVFCDCLQEAAGISVCWAIVKVFCEAVRVGGQEAYDKAAPEKTTTPTTTTTASPTLKCKKGLLNQTGYYDYGTECAPDDHVCVFQECYDGKVYTQKSFKMAKWFCDRTRKDVPMSNVDLIPTYLKPATKKKSLDLDEHAESSLEKSPDEHAENSSKKDKPTNRSSHPDPDAIVLALLLVPSELCY
uniref:Phospholipase A(2) n=1 Tax=Globodera pallida TaxID=36090 RepID=A0A183CEK5_GLOPA